MESQAGGDKSSAPASFQKLPDDQRKELLSLVDQLFTVADSDNSKSIRFSEFLGNHQQLSEMANSRLQGSPTLSAMSEEEALDLFRTSDTDNDLSMNKEEFQKYAIGMIGAMGATVFKDVCSEFIQQVTETREAERQGFDAGNSSLLLDRAIMATTLMEGPSREKCDQLLDARANPNCKDLSGASVLVHAAEKADTGFIVRLLMCRADPLVHTIDYECAAFHASRARNVEALCPLLLPSVYCDESYMALAQTRTDPDASSKKLVRNMDKLDAGQMRELLSNNAEVNFKDLNGWTPLTAAVFWNKRDCVEALLRTTVQFTGTRLRVDAKNSQGRSALHIAARKGLSDLIKIVISNSGDPDLQDAMGWTPLHHASFNGADEAVRALVEGSARLHIKGRNGLTPWMLAQLPSRAGSLSDTVKELIAPPETVRFSNRMAPVLANTSLTPYGKLQALLALPQVNYNPANLRMHEQFFPSFGGPSKVRLQKVWKDLAEPMIRRLRSGDTDLEEPGPHIAEEARKDIICDIESRWKEQRDFVLQWLLDTQGPRPSPEWRHENRAAYLEEMQQVIKEEFEGYRVQLDNLYNEILRAPDGSTLASMPAEEILSKRHLTQLGAHAIPAWLETLDVVGAFEALRLLAVVPGMGKEDMESVMALMELFSANGSAYLLDFTSGRGIWKNIYRLWLVHHAKATDQDFQNRVRSIIDQYNEAAAADDDEVVTYTAAAPKTYERMKIKEREFGEPAAENFHGRSLSANILDVVRGSITVNSPSAAVCLINKFKSLTLVEHKLAVCRVTNRFSRHANVDSGYGYRNVEMNLMYAGGVRQSLCGRRDTTMRLEIVGEVQIVFSDFLAVKRRRHLLWKWSRGQFDWDPKADDEEGEMLEDESPLKAGMG